jgi:hypothetical protein
MRFTLKICMLLSAIENTPVKMFGAYCPTLDGIAHGDMLLQW